MENILNHIIINSNVISLSILLLILGKVLKNSPFIPNYFILWLIIFIGIFLSLISNFSLHSVIEGLIATSLANLYHQIYKQTIKIIDNIPHSKSKVN